MGSLYLWVLHLMLFSICMGFLSTRVLFLLGFSIFKSSLSARFFYLHEFKPQWFLCIRHVQKSPFVKNLLGWLTFICILVPRTIFDVNLLIKISFQGCPEPIQKIQRKITGLHFSTFKTENA